MGIAKLPSLHLLELAREVEITEDLSDNGYTIINLGKRTISSPNITSIADCCPDLCELIVDNGFEIDDELRRAAPDPTADRSEVLKFAIRERRRPETTLEPHSFASSLKKESKSERR
jgi:hypothetical protein